MIAELPAVGTLTVTNQWKAILLELSVRRHVLAWWLSLEVFDRPNLRHPRVRAAEQRVRDAEYAEQWDAVEQGWTDFLSAVRSVTP